GADRLDVTVAAVAASAAQSTLAVSPTTVAAGGTATATVTVKDAYGNVITNATSSAFSASTSGGSLGAFNCTLGVCTATYTAPILAGAKTISATIGGTDIGNSPATVTVTAGAAARFVIFGAATQNAGASQNITIRALDANGNVATGYTGAKNLTFSGASASPAGNDPTASATAFGTTTSVTFTAGEATGVALVLFKAETAVIAATDGSVSATGADRLDVTVAAVAASAAQSTLAVSPTSVAAGGTATATVTVRDAYGNVITNATSSAFSASTSGGSLGAFNCTLGVCTATYTAPILAGAKTISATIGGTDIGNSPATVTVTAGAAARFVILGAATQVAGASQNITIRALDANGNIATSYTGAKTLTFSGASVSANSNAPTIGSTAFGTGTSVTFASGEATLVAMTLYTAETAVIATTDGSVSATSTDRLTVTVSADNASPVVTDITAAPTSIVANGTSESTLSITLKDAYGNATASVASPGTVVLVKSAGTGTLLGSLTNAGGGVYTQQVQSPAAAGSGTFAATLNGTQTTNTATVTYESAGGVLSRVVCTTSQPAGQSAASSTTVNLCSNATAGDLEIVTLALDGTDDLSAPASGGADGTWVKIASTLQTTGSGGNKPMLLILYARRYAAGLNRVVTFTAGTNHKWSVDMVTLQSSGVALPSAADVSVANNSTGAALSIASPFTATADNTVLYHVFANSGTGATATITPNTSLTTLGTNNTGGTSSLSFLEIVANTVTAPTRSFTSSVSANTVLIRLVVRP
ncbi:MAG: Ig-like domain-containing protein, partial [Gemmatimonadota bacterium]|nr:Ig-like domain-containing protein [Gemmatimonadota bacterium]